MPGWRLGCPSQTSQNMYQIYIFLAFLVDKMNNIPDKPFLNFDEQSNKLQNEYKLIISDRDEAMRLLKNFSYYDLVNGYKKVFMINDEYFDDVSIEDLYYFMLYDRNVQNNLFKYSVYVENKFKNILAHVVSKHYGVYHQNYLDKANFKNKGKYVRRTLSSIQNCIREEKLGHPTKYYLSKHNHLPAWILFKNITFNQAIDIFVNLKLDVKLEVVDLISDGIFGKNKVSIITKALIIVRKFRNAIAHNLNFINHRTSDELVLSQIERTKFKSLIEHSDYKNKRGSNDPYAMIISMAIILNDDDLLVDFFTDTYNSFISQSIDSKQYKKLFTRYSEISNIPIDVYERFGRQIDSAL